MLPRVFTSLGLLGFVATAAALGACGEQSSKVSTPVQPAPSSSAANDSADASAPAAHEATVDAGYDGPRIGALFLTTPVMSDMEWPSHDKPRRAGGSQIVGYIRQGGTVPVIPEPHVKENCKDGWYELLAGGFVCGKYASLDLNHPRIKTGPHTPNLDGPLPYDYGVNITNGTPLYRTVPSRDERNKLEPWLVRKPKPPPVDPFAVNPATAPVADDLDAGVIPPPSATTLASIADPFGLAPEDGGTPWYLRQYDGGKPMITLDELREDGGPIERRMVKGFYLAIDKEWKDTHNTKWWKTTGGLLAPFDRVYIAKSATEFRGVWLSEDGPLVQSASIPADAGLADAGPERKEVADKSALAWILWVHAKKYYVSPDKKKVTTGDGVPRHYVMRLTGVQANIAGYTYLENDEGWWMRTNEGTFTKPGPTPPNLKQGEKWIDVNLTTQTLVAFEGDKPVYATLVSSGKRDLQDPEKDHATPKGAFRIREKHIAATMDGDVATDGPYSIEDVPWIMYFSGSYALHGAFWHSNFGRTKSHGCVNLSPVDAHRMFGWTDPQLPDGWHGVSATDDKPGTRVVVHD
jgi:lipoprotein-anchoring transpeptidase ErfK/SrfK